MMQTELNALRIVENTRASKVEGVINIDSDDEDAGSEGNQVAPEEIFVVSDKKSTGDTSDERKTEKKVKEEDNVVNVVDSV